mgnify:CR=1 FL=1
MIRTQEATGKTVDEARTNACALLGVEKDDINVSYEVLEMPQKTGFLGLKLTPAKVRVSSSCRTSLWQLLLPPLRSPLPLWRRRLPLWRLSLSSKRLPLKLPLLWKSLLPLRKLPLPKSRLLPPQRAKRWKSPSTSRRTPRSRPLWTT